MIQRLGHLVVFHGNHRLLSISSRLIRIENDRDGAFADMKIMSTTDSYDSTETLI